MPQLFRRILVPHDFSEHATRALKVAGDLAAMHRGRINVLHAIPPFVPVGAFPGGEVPIWIPPDDLVVSHRRRLNALATRVLARSRVPFQCHVSQGDPLQEILAAARKADLIVMATQGRTGLSHLVIGSVAEKVVRHSPVPVLTLRPAARAATSRRAASKATRAATLRKRATGRASRQAASRKTTRTRS